MTVTITEELKSKAEVYYGDELSQSKTKLLLKEVGLPSGLLPLKDISEVGYVEETGFVWLRQKKKVEHLFKSIGKVVSYASEITGYVEKGRIKKVNGVKAKEVLIWIPVYEISVDDPPTGKLTCKSTGGLFKTFPTSAFELPEPKEVNKEENESQEPAEETKLVDKEENEVKEPAVEAKKVNGEENEKKENDADMAITVPPRERVLAPIIGPAAQVIGNK